MARRGVMLSIGVAASVAAIAIGAFGIANAMGTPPGPEIISETPLIAPATTPEPTVTGTPPADPADPGGSGSPGSGGSEQTNPPTQPVAPPPVVVDDDDDDDEHDDEYDDDDDDDD